MDPCEIIKDTIIEFTDKDVSSNIFVKKNIQQDTNNLTEFWVGFKGFTDGFPIRISNYRDESNLKNMAWLVAYEMNKPDFLMK